MLSSPHKRAFTLIELLVVIAIISILAAILFPVFARARENARRTSCLSNLKQQGLGIMQYVQDYDETYPMVFNYGPDAKSGGGDDSTWINDVQPYVKSRQLFFCPSSGSVNNLNGHYGANKAVMPSSGDVLSKQPMRVSAVQSASTIYMIMDYGNYYAEASNVSLGNSTSWGYLPGMGGGGTTCQVTATTAMDRVSDCKSGRHFGGVSMAFADGHVKWLKSQVIVVESKKSSTISAWQPTH